MLCCKYELVSYILKQILTNYFQNTLLENNIQIMFVLFKNKKTINNYTAICPLPFLQVAGWLPFVDLFQNGDVSHVIMFQ